MLFLLPLTLLPFLTELRATYPDDYVTTFLYAGANIVCGILLLVMWKYGMRKGLLVEIAPEVDRSMRRRILLGIAINILGAAAALINTYLSSVFFLLLPVIYFSHHMVDSHWMADGEDPTSARA